MDDDILKSYHRLTHPEKMGKRADVCRRWGLYMMRLSFPRYVKIAPTGFGKWDYNKAREKTTCAFCIGCYEVRELKAPFQRKKLKICQEKMAKRKLQRQLKLIHVIMLGTAGTIAAEIFVLTGHAAGIAGPDAVWAIIIGGVLSLSIALNYCELATTYPVTGGAMTYVKEGFGNNLIMFLVGSLDGLSSTFYAAKIGVSGYRGTLKGLSISGYFLRSITIAKDAQKSTNMYPALEIKLRKSTSPMNVTKPLTTTTSKMAT